MKLNSLYIIIGYIILLPLLIIIPWLIIFLLPFILIVFSIILMLAISTEKIASDVILKKTDIDYYYIEDSELEYILFCQKESMIYHFISYKL
jgi:hypothetical protein